MAGLLVAALMPACEARADDYRLGVQDKVRIKVFEWRAPQEAVHEWIALNGEFIVSASGAIALPLVGDVPAAGATPNELGREIGERLKSRVGLVQTPSASVEIVQFRPFYILGRVERPGEYPYRPGLTVLQAMSIAGGLPRLADPALLRVDRESISAHGSVNILLAEINALVARRARLEAELEGSNTIEFPPDLMEREGDEAVSRILREERLLLKGRQESLRSQVEASNDLKALIQKEIEALGSKLQLKDRQLILIRKELEGVGALVSKGLAVVPRQFSLERAEAEIEGSRLELETALLKARQDVSRTERDILELRNKEHNEILTEIRQTQEKLEEANHKLSMAQRLLSESDQFAAQFATEGTGDEEVQTHFSIVRKVDGTLVEKSVSDTAPVEPGDVVKVRITKQKPVAQLTSRALPLQPEGVVIQVP